MNIKEVWVDVSLLKLETRNSGKPAWFPGSNLKLETGCLCSGTVVGGRPIEALSNFARLGIWILVQLKSKSSSLSSKISEMEVAPRYKLLEHCLHCFTLATLVTPLSLLTLLTLLSLITQWHICPHTLLCGKAPLWYWLYCFFGLGAKCWKEWVYGYPFDSYDY